MTVVVFFLLIISIIGWSLFVSNAGKIYFPEATFTVMAAMGCLMMLAFIAKIPIFAARLLVYGGWVVLIGQLLMMRDPRKVKVIIKHYQPMIITMFMGMLIISLMAWGMKFSSIDDYSFWGTISRYLFVFNQLPENANFIKGSFLQYTPGLACFHYLFYQLAGYYSPMLNYVAQDLILLAPLLLFIDEKRYLMSLTTVFVVIITLYLAFGNILAKLEVDATLAMWFFAMIYMAIRPQLVSIWTMFFGAVFLSIVKEIGLLFSVFVVCIYFACHCKQSGQIKKAGILISGLFLMKLVWLYHVTAHGFKSFAEKITFSKALTALTLGHPDYGLSQTLFLKELLFSNFDHIFNIPFVAILMLLIWQIYRLYRSKRLQPNHIVLFKGFSILIPFFLLNLYLFQAIVFRVGYQHPHLLDFPRYFNSAFVPFILSVLFVSFYTVRVKPYDKLKKMATVLSIVAMIFIVGGKIERTKKYYHPFDYNRIAAVIQEQSKGSNMAMPICLKKVPSPDYRVLMPLQYFIMPKNIINVDQKSTKNCEQTFDFALLNR